jgi:hypothetical protein
LSPVLQGNEVSKVEKEASTLQAYKDQMDKQQFLGEIRGFKEAFLNMRDRLPQLEQYRLKVFFNYLDTIGSAFKNDKISEKSARAAYDVLTAQINELFEDNSKNSKPSFESFSEDVRRFLIHIDTYLIKNPSACSNSIASTIQLLKQLDNKRSFNPEQSFKDFCSYKEIMIQLLLKPFETPVAEIATAPATGADLIEKQSGIKTRLGQMRSSANKDAQPVISPSLIRGSS